jgi:tetratricopeptide (TPR) repeat protein
VYDVRDLNGLESQARGDLLYHIQELLFGNHLLAAHIVRDQRKFSLSHYHVNEAVRVAKAMQDSDLTATALYTRGCTYLEWGIFGLLNKGVYQIQHEKIEASILDWENAKKIYKDEEKDMHIQLSGRIDVHLGRAYALLSVSKGEKVPGLALTLLDQAEDTAGVQNIDDSYTRALIVGERVSFTKGGYHSTRAAAFTDAKMPGAALKELNAVETLQQGVSKDLTRRHVWLNIIAANAFLHLENFEEATKHARSALIASQDINSITNLTNVMDIYGRLLRSPYNIDVNVQELGDMLRDAFTTHIQQK